MIGESARPPTEVDRGSFTPAFRSARRGYDRAEVDEFVDACRAALAEIAEENRLLRAADHAARGLARVHADTARQRDERDRLRAECAELRVEVDRLRTTRDAVRRDLEAMAATLRSWLATHDSDGASSRASTPGTRRSSSGDPEQPG